MDLKNITKKQIILERLKLFGYGLLIAVLVLIAPAVELAGFTGWVIWGVFMILIVIMIYNQAQIIKGLKSL